MFNCPVCKRTMSEHDYGGLRCLSELSKTHAQALKTLKEAHEFVKDELHQAIGDFQNELYITELKRLSEKISKALKE